MLPVLPLTVYANCRPVILNLCLAISQIWRYLRNMDFSFIQWFVDCTFWFISNWVCLLFLMRCFRCFHGNKWQEDFILCLCFTPALEIFSHPTTTPVALQVTLISQSLWISRMLLKCLLGKLIRNLIFSTQGFEVLFVFTWEDHSSLWSICRLLAELLHGERLK